jgi:hypothetical protein
VSAADTTVELPPAAIAVVRGRPTPAELAAAVAVLLAAVAAVPATPPGRTTRPSGWAASARPRPVAPLPGPRQWRASGLPRY